MLSNDPAESKPSSPPSASGAGAAGNSDDCSRKPIEAGPEGGGTGTDPGATDKKPLGVSDLELLLG
jgi:hypothetical protein